MRTLLSALLLFATVPVSVAAKEYTAERFDSRIEVLQGGSLRVTETVIIRFQDGTFTFFYRTLPTRKTDGIEFVSASMDGTNFPVGDGAGRVEVRRKEGLRIEWHFAPITPSTHTFELTYIAKGVAARVGDADVIAWRALPSDHDYRIGASRIEMALPVTSSVAPTFEVRGVGKWTESHTDARVVVEAQDIRKDGWLEISASLANGTVLDTLPVWQQRQLRAREYAMPFAVAASIVFFAGLVVLFGIRQNYDAPTRDTAAARTFTGPPDSSPPAIAGALIANGSLHLEHAMGTLFDLASRGVIAIHELPRGAFGQRKFTITRKTDSRPLAPHERTLIEEIFSAKGASGGEVPLDKARAHLVRHFSRVKKVVETEMTEAGLFDAGRRQIKHRYIVVGLTLLGAAIVAIVPAVILVERADGWGFLIALSLGLLAATSFIFAAAHTPLSNDGVRRAAAWRAYRKQLRQVPKELTRADWSRGPQSPADLLPLAVALGLASGWAKIFKDRAAQLPPWFHAASSADANTGFVAFVGHGGAGTGGGARGGAGGGAAGGGGSGAG